MFTKARLNILLPTTFVIAMSEFPFIVAIKLTPSSGALVPNATTVNPITRGETPKEEANFEELLTTASPPITRSSKPTIDNDIEINMIHIYINLMK